MDELKIVKKVNKNYFTLGEDIEVIITLKNIGNHTLSNVYYLEEQVDFYSIVTDSIFIDGFNIKLRAGTNIINIGEIQKDEEKSIMFKLKVLNIHGNGKIDLKGRVSYYSYGIEKFKDISVSTIVCGVSLKILDIFRDKEILFNDETCTYRLSIVNEGNMIASNVVLKYDNSGRLRTSLGTIYVNNINIEGGYIEEGINIGTIFENETKNIEFKVCGKKEAFEYIKDDSIIIAYSTMNPNESSPRTYELIKEIKPLMLVKDMLTIEKESEEEIINKETFAKIKTTIKNDTGVTIKNFRLSENFSTLVTLKDITLNKDIIPKIEGNHIIIDEIKNNSIATIEYKVYVRDTDEDFLEIYSEGIYNVGAFEFQKRFKKESRKIYIELNMNRLEIKTKVQKNNIILDEGFERNITVTNIGNKDINRIRLFDMLNMGARIVKGSFSIDNDIINTIDSLNDGIDIGKLSVGGKREIKYKGEFLEYFIERNLELKCYCTYNVKCKMTEEVSESHTETKIDRLQIDRTIHEFTLEKKIDIKKMYIKEILDIHGNGSIKYANTVNILKEIKSEGRFVPCKNLLTKGYLDVSVEYSSYSSCNEDKQLCSLNIPIEFSEVVESTITKENIKNYLLNVKTVEGIIKEGYLIITCLLEIVIN
ncbi:MAG: hypothetical protein ACRC28_00680 [Clostridium sp.]|uniref:hypothetical protein n=1 Tax=Clostridium sp. TaxID=1506 RepID=UPI003F35C1A7